MRILFAELHENTLFSFRKELLDVLISQGHEIHLALATGKRVFAEYGSKVAQIHDVAINLKDKGLVSNLKLRNRYKRLIRSVKPDLIISYTIKPNIYCAFYAKRIPMIANITGLGNIFKKKGLLSWIGIHLYRRSFKNVRYLFFQNQDGHRFFKEHGIPVQNYRIIPGSGVNTSRFSYRPVAVRKERRFLFASRAIKEKGFDLLISAIPSVLSRHPEARFSFLTAEEDVWANPEARVLFETYKDQVSVLPRSNDMAEVYWAHDFLVSPSFYREGISNVLLESLSCGRPIITTNDNPGCAEVLVEGKNGLGVRSENEGDLVEALCHACELSLSEIEEMGRFGRDYVMTNFERKKVIDIYLSTIAQIEGDKR